MKSTNLQVLENAFLKKPMKIDAFENKGICSI